jgi:ferritin
MRTFEDFREFGGEQAAEPVVVIAPSPATATSHNSPMTPVALPAEIVKGLESRLKDEYTAHLIYRNAANWCKNANYKKAAAFFEAEAMDELEHAKSLQDYMTQWNILPQIPVCEVPNKITSLVQAINEAYVFEYNLLVSYSELQNDFDKTHPASFNFIQGFVNIQNESVAVFSDLLNALNLIDVNNRLDVLMFEDKYFS